MSRLPNTNVLLTDFDLNSGMVRFMLKLDNSYCVTDAAEHSLDMDESLWPTMVTTLDKLDVLHAGKLNPDFRVEPTQIRHLMEFMRRNYGALCFDLSGNLERYSLEIMHESKRIFLVCTPEIPSLHLAREKYMYLKQLDLADRGWVQPLAGLQLAQDGVRGLALESLVQRKDGAVDDPGIHRFDLAS